MKMIVGLGNPGKQYEKTRHNTGFMVLDRIADKLNIEINKKEFNALTARNKQLILVKPQTYMNNSGQAVSQIINYYQIDIEDILVIYDDLDLKYGQLRLRPKGSSGGHNGIKSIINYLHSEDFKRIRIGIEKNPLIDTADYVLGQIEKDKQQLYNDSLNKAAEAAIEFITTDFERVMNKYNKGDQ
ncbi:MAG: aminoacyl-tRNA hydrolase [Erysipelotrichaceae bacterium]